jgi:hypothetical protein
LDDHQSQDESVRTSAYETIRIKQLPGGSIGPRYYFQLGFTEKSQNLLITHQLLKLE